MALCLHYNNFSFLWLILWQKNLSNSVDYLTIPSFKRERVRVTLSRQSQKQGSRRKRKCAHLCYRSQFAWSAYTSGMYKWFILYFLILKQAFWSHIETKNVMTVSNLHCPHLKYREEEVMSLPFSSFFNVIS